MYLCVNLFGTFVGETLRVWATERRRNTTEVLSPKTVYTARRRGDNPTALKVDFSVNNATCAPHLNQKKRSMEENAPKKNKHPTQSCARKKVPNWTDSTHRHAHTRAHTRTPQSFHVVASSPGYRLRLHNATQTTHYFFRTCARGRWRKAHVTLSIS